METVTRITGTGLDSRKHSRRIPIPQFWQVESQRHGTTHPKTDVVVAIVRGIPVAVGTTAVPRVVVPRTAAQEPEVPVPSSRSRNTEVREYLLLQMPGVTMVKVGQPAL